MRVYGQILGETPIFGQKCEVTGPIFAKFPKSKNLETMYTNR